MKMILQNLASPALEEAIEANLTEELVCFGRGLPQAELHKTPELVWFFTGQSGPNGVLWSRFARADKNYIMAKIDEILTYFKARQVSVGWTIGPSTRPINLATFLEAFRFRYHDQTQGMAADLLALNEDIPLNQQLIIREAEDPETLKILRSIEMKGFGASAELAQNYYDSYINLGFGKGKPWHHYIGWLNNEPVSIASLFFYAGVAGIYGVATIPEVRRQGIAATMTLHVLHEAGKQGYRVAILSPSEMSIAIYRRIGFQEYCKLLHYRWSPGE
jgi:ribosomal protein S18 acetylase RimI-like enzyme